MKFIDLFAGLGGFHIGLQRNGHECVFASEKIETLANLYYDNFGIIPNRDITKIDINKIPKHDILCAGFPCQPFSKAGSQKGLKDERNGSLFDKIVEILDCHKPQYFILENVRNLLSHDEGKTWKYIHERLVSELNYSVDKHIFSPHHFGIPQHRERFFIIGSKNGLEHFEWPKVIGSQTSIFNYLDSEPKNVTKLDSEKIRVLNLWQEFLDKIPKSEKLPSWPIWSMEFGATYPFEEKTPFASQTFEMENTKGNFGISLNGMTKEKIFENLPSYAITKQTNFPSWKKHYIRSNRAFYEKYKVQLAPIIEKIKDLNVPSWQKLEWNVQGGERIIKNYIIQFRGSGIRLKKTDYFPSLVTVSTQIPILGWEERYITPEEGARIQCLNNIKLPENLGTCFSALGNAVNAHIVEIISSKLIKNQINRKISLENAYSKFNDNKFTKKVAI